jgi:hypothetical protein
MHPAPTAIDSNEISVYVPSYSLQGEDLPCHVRWKGSEPISVLIELPPELSVKEVYNVPVDGVTEQTPKLVRFSNFTLPGYLGLLLRTSRTDGPRRDVQITFRISTRDGNSLRVVSRAVSLFRPLLTCVEIPDELLIDSRSGTLQSKTPRIVLENIGDGTAIVLVKLLPGSKGKIGPSSRADEFENKFKEDVLAGILRAREDFPRHTRLLDEFTELLREPLTLNAQTTKRMRSINRRARAAYRKDKSLFARVVQILAEAYFGNLELVTELSSFLDYLNSVGEGRVVILNALDALHLKKGNSRIAIELQVADAAYGMYPALELPAVQVSSPVDTEIPVHRLFDWKTEIIRERGEHLRLLR